MFSRSSLRPKFLPVIILALALMLVSAPVMAAPLSPTPRAPVTLLTLPAAHIVTQVVMAPVSPNILPLGNQVNLTFNYKTDYPAGVRIFTRPFTAGALTPNYGGNPSPLYPVGTGSASGFFTITSGDVVVDQVRIEVVAADTSAVLADYFLPVHYHFSAAADLPYNLSFSPQTPNLIGINQRVNLSFQYKSTFAGGVRIFLLPISGGSPTSGFGVSGSPLYTGTGMGTAFFEIMVGTPIVDQIRFDITSGDQSQHLGDFLLPVHYQVTNSTTAINNITLTAPTANPNVLENGQNVNLTFSYTTDVPGGVRIFARPMTGSALTPNYGASGSPLYPVGAGTGNGSFSIFSGNALVDGIRFQVLTADQSTLLFEKVIPVHYLFGGNLPLPIISYSIFVPIIDR